MRKNVLLALISCALVLCTTLAFAAKKEIKLQSPNGKLELSIQLGDTLSYSVQLGNEKLISNSHIGLELANGTFLGKQPRLLQQKIRRATEDITSPHYRFNSFNTSYNELNLKLSGNYGVLFRAYNEGIAYRFYTGAKNEIEIQNELAEFNFEKDNTTYLSYTTGKKDPFAMAFQNTYDVKRLSEASNTLAFLPVTVDCGGGVKLTILESDLESYPGMFVQSLGIKQSLKGVFAKLPVKTDLYPWRKQEYVTERAVNIAKVKGTRAFPWRILAVSEKDTDMPVNNLVYALASPNRIGDYAWVKGGKVAWDWWNDWGISDVDFKAGINMDTYKHYIDFASEKGIEYIVLDEGWYKPASGDMMTVIPELNLPELVAYAKSKKVDIILWTVFNVLDAQLEQACKYYSQLGIKGFKVDFLDRNDQKAVEMTYRIAEMTAKYKLILDLHGFYTPTGLNRTYPNIINFESVFGLEEMKWSTTEKDMPQYDVTFPFIRLAAGSVDYTPGAMRNATKKDFKDIYYNPMSQGTRCHQLATYIVFDSPLTMLADNPTAYRKEQACTSFIASLALETDETKILQGEIGKYIVSARRNGNNWQVGALTNWEERDVKLNLDFLSDGTYKAEIMKDGQNANKQAQDYKHETLLVTKDSVLPIHLAQGGGFAIKFVQQKMPKVAAVPQALNLPPFYKKYLDAYGISIISSQNVSNEALLTAREIITGMLSMRKDIARKMVEKMCKIIIIGAKEQVCDIPEYANICTTPDSIAFWNKRARGFGDDNPVNPNASCGEENLICLAADRYEGENILIHEFAHLIHSVGIVGVNPGFNKELETVMNHAKEKGLWMNTYALTNKEEYFAETVQSFFNCNRYSEKPNGVHNENNRREKLKLYDPEMYKLLLQYFPAIDLPIRNLIHS
jgi:alpha-glucosidase